MKKDREILSAEDSHPIERIMSGAMTKIKALADTDTIVGSPVFMPDGTTLIPVSKVSVGFVTGGGEYSDVSKNKSIDSFPFAGGSGAGISVKPLGFLVKATGGSFKMVSVDGENAYQKMLGLLPDVIDSLTRPDARG